MLLLLGAIGIVIGQLIGEGPCTDATHFTWPSTFDFTVVLGAITNIVYAYAGHWMYFEIMAEMREPKDFPKIFIVNGCVDSTKTRNTDVGVNQCGCGCGCFFVWCVCRPVMVLMYLLVACTGYYFSGNLTPANFVDSIDFAPTSLFTVSVMLFVHVAFVYFVKVRTT